MLKEALSFSNHGSHLRKKLIDRLKMLKKVRLLAGGDMSFQLHEPLILRVLDYADLHYGSLSARDCNRSQTIQNCTFRIIKRVDIYAASAALHNNLEMMYLPDRRHFHCCNQVYKAVNNLAPTFICDKFVHTQHQLYKSNQ